MSLPHYNYYIGGFVRVIDETSPYQRGEVLRVCYLSENEEGDKYLGFSDYMEAGNWSSYHFEPVRKNEDTDEYVREINAGPTMQVSVEDYNELLKDAQWWAAAVNCKVQDWCGFPDVVAEYNRMEKEE